MSEHFEVMPDYLASLELELRARAGASVRTKATRGSAQPWRRPLLAAAAAVLAVFPLMLIADTVGDHTSAYGRPAILAARAVRLPPSIRDGFALRAAAGPGTSLKWARPIHAFGDVAYLLNGDGVWCLSAPDARSVHPDAERGVTCTYTREFFRVGIQLVLRDRYIAVIPQGVKDPMVVHPDGRRTTLHPNALGVVTVDPIAPGDAFVLYGVDGQRRTRHAR